MDDDRMASDHYQQGSVPVGLPDQPAEVAIPWLLDEYGVKLHRLSLKLCGHAEDAEDLVQEIFLNAFRKWHQFKGESNPTTWLYTIAVRACGRRRRKRSGEPHTMASLSDLLPAGEDQIPDLTLIAGPFEEQLRREAREAVEHAISAVPFHFRMPLVLKEIVELPIAEIASILGLKPATVKTRVHRGLLLLRRELARKLPRKDAPPPDHSRRVCLDLLQAKQEALDRGVPFRVPQEDLCDSLPGDVRDSRPDRQRLPAARPRRATPGATRAIGARFRLGGAGSLRRARPPIVRSGDRLSLCGGLRLRLGPVTRSVHSRAT